MARRSHEEVLSRFGNAMVHHEGMADIFAAAIGNYGYILRGPELEPLQEAAEAILEHAPVQSAAVG